MKTTIVNFAHKLDGLLILKQFYFSLVSQLLLTLSLRISFQNFPIIRTSTERFFFFVDVRTFHKITPKQQQKKSTAGIKINTNNVTLQ